jgi:ribosomal protein L11 methyltransferase
MGTVPSRVLDVGTGSGILAIAAIRLGSDRVVGYDIDPAAVEAARTNAAANGLADQIEVHQGTLPADAPAEPFPLVLANLVAAVLVDLAPRLASHTARGGWLIASGIIDTREDEVASALVAAGLTIVASKRDGEWVTFVTQRAL